jgi:hypothetical protein
VAPDSVDGAFWARLDELADLAPRVEDLFHHRLAAVAARRLRAMGLPLPRPLLEEERFAAACTLAAPLVLERVLAAVDAPLMVFKGPEVAVRYPQATMRPHHDLDLLVEDSAAAHRALRAAGCVESWDRPSRHHQLPLLFPDLPLIIELHHQPKCPDWSAVPTAARLLETAVPSRWDPRVLAPPPAEHAVLLAAHAWVERPLRRVLDMVDQELMLAEADRAQAASIATTWRLRRVWEATSAATEAVLRGGAAPWTLRTWARNMTSVRERTRSEELLERALAHFAAMPPRQALRCGTTALAEAMNPRSGKTLAGRLRRGPYEHPALSGELSSRARSPANG